MVQGGLGAWLSGGWVFSLPEYVEHLRMRPRYAPSLSVCSATWRRRAPLKRSAASTWGAFSTPTTSLITRPSGSLPRPEGSSKVGARPPCQRAGRVSVVLHLCWDLMTDLLFPGNCQLENRNGNPEGLEWGRMESHLWLLKPEPFRTIIFASSPTISPPPPPLQSEQDQAENEGEGLSCADGETVQVHLCQGPHRPNPHAPSSAISTITPCTPAGTRPRDLMLMSHLQDNIQHADPPVR